MILVISATRHVIAWMELARINIAREAERSVKVFSTVANCRIVAFGTDFWPECDRLGVDPFLVWPGLVSVCPYQCNSLLGF